MRLVLDTNVVLSGLLWRSHPRHLLDLAKEGTVSLYTSSVLLDELFEDAARVFLDPNRIETFDGRETYGEDRWKTVGLVEPALLTVVYSVRRKEGDIF